MSKNLTDVDTFTDPIVVPVDGDTQNAASVEVGFQGLSNRTRHLYNVLDLPLGSITKDIDGTSMVADTDSGGNVHWKPVFTNMSAQTTTVAVSASIAKYDLGPYIREGGTLTRVYALVKPGSGHTTGMVLTVVRRDAAIPFTGPPSNPSIATLATSSASSGTSNQTLDSGALSESTDNNASGKSWSAYVAAGDNVPTVTDIIWGIRIVWTPTKVTNG